MMEGSKSCKTDESLPASGDGTQGMERLAARARFKEHSQDRFLDQIKAPKDVDQRES